MQRSLASITIAAMAAWLAAGCSSIGANEGLKGGELGNGDFAFSCDDSVPCNSFNRSLQFPNSVARGSTFSVLFYPKSNNAGVTLTSVGEDFLSRTSTGSFAAVHAGMGTLVARDNTGAVVDFTNVQVEIPDSIAIYEDRASDGSGNLPTTVTNVQLNIGSGRAYRALARKNNAVLAGRLEYQWESESANILSVDTVQGVRATLVGHQPGSTTMTVSGGSFTQTIVVSVVP